MRVIVSRAGRESIPTAALTRRAPCWTNSCARRGGDEALRRLAPRPFGWTDPGPGGALFPQVTPPEFRFRGEACLFSCVAIRPTVAAALVWLSRPTGDDVFLDPFCGSGRSPLSEQLRLPEDPGQRHRGGSIGHGAPKRRGFRGEVRRISPLGHEGVAVGRRTSPPFTTNPPWGGQIGAGDDLAALYRTFDQRDLTPGAKSSC